MVSELIYSSGTKS